MFALRCHGNATRAPIANPPNSAQLGGIPYRSFIRQLSPDGTTTITEAADIQLHLTTHLSTHRPRKDERLSWPGWLTHSGWFTHISGHPSATGRAQDSESTPAKDRRSAAGPRNQLTVVSRSWYQRALPCGASRPLLKVIEGALPFPFPGARGQKNHCPRLV